MTKQKPFRVNIDHLKEKCDGNFMPLVDLGLIVDIFRFLTRPDVRKELGIPDSAVYMNTDYNEENRRYHVSNLYHPTSRDVFSEEYSEAELNRMMKRYQKE
ncbi:MAG: hypothetical protein PHD81_02030 [Candidatus Nanoarchaeia archaeon]|nr:hypothetical protein [Candidatus Nanoarchaeia archaeon]MDD5587868.1 hypothetical protein [Candidatus Nanoarchaeia archaeon]